MSDFFSYQKIKHAKKEYICECCNTKILKGEPYFRNAGKYEGRFFTEVLCPVCSQIVDYYTYDLGHEEYDLSELIGETYKDYPRIYELLKEIPHPSEFVKDCIMEYEEMKLEEEMESEER
jgi:hypothetical protein